MNYVSHPLIKPETIEDRDYQRNILKTASSKNTLIVLPTGTGKTPIAILLAAERLQSFPDSKILIMAPTRPLCAQHQKSFQDILNLSEEDIILITGKIPPYARERFYKNAKVISATPQTIRNDLENGILNLADFSLVVVDECHRSVKKYAYPEVAASYKNNAKNPLILGLTASPGYTEEKIKEICKSLFIEAVEIRTETDRDVKPYVKDLNVEWIRVDLPDIMKDVQENFKKALRNRIEKLRDYKININMKRDLLEAQKKISRKISTERKPIYYHLISLVTESIKIWYALELLETQSISSFKKYIEKLRINNTRSNRGVLSDSYVKSSIQSIENFDAEHPKIEKIVEIVKKEIEENKEKRIIVFSHYRDNISKLYEMLKEVSPSAILIGQKEGLSQKEQIDVIKDFNAGVYNCLITSPVGEEGLHIPSADIAIFYDSVPSEIRTIQRRGRVGRTKIGKIIFLLTRKTRDESNYWSAYRKEKRMKTILKEMQSQKNLKGF